MIRLFNGLGSARWLVMCLDAQGNSLFTVGDTNSAPRELKPLMQPGRSILESALGTTAPGCSIACGQPAVVTRNEHYLHELKDFFCASAPILAGDGSLAGVLDISGVEVETLPLASDLIDFAARRIENEIVAGQKDCWVVEFHCDERALGTPFEGILAVSPDGTVQGMNRSAKKILSLPADAPVRSTLSSIFEGDLSHLIAHSETTPGQVIRIRSSTGVLPYVKIRRQETRVRIARRSGDGHGVHRPQVRPPPVLDDAGLRNQFDKAQRVLNHRLPVILAGETGTGKEVVARALHRAVRPAGPFVAVNCAAIPETLIESELFGYEDGAFTGGRRGGTAGKIEQADGGILFLDEIGDMPLAMQSRLLRVIQEQSVSRLGSGREVSVDFLVISATHRDIDELVLNASFREDLFYRLSGYRLTIPPLRERTDFAQVLEALVRKHVKCSQISQAAIPIDLLITSAARHRLASHRWPGNIRQLDSVICTIVALLDTGRAIDIGDIPPHLFKVEQSAGSQFMEPGGENQTLSQQEGQSIQQALRHHGGNISSAARQLGISRATLYRKVRILKGIS
jgi:transcriptional regulator of acetoin/glycerol metabolism